MSGNITKCTYERKLHIKIIAHIVLTDYMGCNQFDLNQKPKIHNTYPFMNSNEFHQYVTTLMTSAFGYGDTNIHEDIVEENNKKIS